MDQQAETTYAKGYGGRSEVNPDFGLSVKKLPGDQFRATYVSTYGKPSVDGES
jgi:hypothetical protein